MRNRIVRALVCALVFTSLTVTPVSAHKSSYCGHHRSGVWGMERVYYVSSHKHFYSDAGGSIVGWEHHHKYEHKQFSPLGWLHHHWQKHKRCPKH
jgi:hypothetical protein